MSQLQRVGTLEVGQDLRFQRGQWRAQRYGWLALCAVLGLALLGLLGHGPLSNATAGAAGGPVRLDYQRFARHGDPTRLEFRLSSAAVRDGRVRLWLDRDYLRHVKLESVTPRPESEEAGPDRHLFVFRAASADGDLLVCVRLQPDTAGRLRGRAGLEGGPDLAFTQFVYP
jgi:hypothetical protein